jgi:hypothetical protein
MLGAGTMVHIDLHDSLDDVPAIGTVELGVCPQSGDVISFGDGQYEVIMVFGAVPGDGPDMQGIAAMVARIG